MGRAENLSDLIPIEHVYDFEPVPSVGKPASCRAMHACSTLDAVKVARIAASVAHTLQRPPIPFSEGTLKWMRSLTALAIRHVLYIRSVHIIRRALNRITVERDGLSLHIGIWNTAVDPDTRSDGMHGKVEQGFGVGMGNLRARLAQLYGTAWELTLDNASPAYAKVRIALPYHEAANADAQPLVRIVHG